MLSSEIIMRVAQNCHGYRGRSDLALINSITYVSESCNSCVSNVRGKCTKELFNEIMETIRLN